MGRGQDTSLKNKKTKKIIIIIKERERAKA
jgi:hypothetical protein